MDGIMCTLTAANTIPRDSIQHGSLLRMAVEIWDIKMNLRTCRPNLHVRYLHA